MKKRIKLTKLQYNILTQLENGALIVVDKMNMAHLGDQNIASQTRYFLTQNGLITRLDKTKSVDVKGNGFVISEKGLTVIEGKL